MKILHLNTETPWRGGENQLHILSSGLVEHGQRVYLGLKKGSALDQKTPEFRPHKFSVGKLLPLSLLRLAKFCRREGIDIITAHSGPTHTLALAAKFLYPKLTVVVHRRVVFAPSRNPWHDWKYGSPLVDGYVAVSDAVRQGLIDFGVNPAKIFVVPSCYKGRPAATDERKRRKKELCTHLGLPEDIPLLVQAAALDKAKDQDTLLSACKILMDQNIPFHCIIAGTGERQRHLEKRRMELGLDHHVTFLGFVQETATLLRSCDVFVMTSTAEGLGTAVLEAMAAGCLLVSTRSGGLAEIALPEETALTFAVGDSAACATELKRMLAVCRGENPLLEKTLRAGMQRLLLGPYSAEQMIAGTLSVYEFIQHQASWRRDILRNKVK